MLILEAVNEAISIYSEIQILVQTLKYRRKTTCTTQFLNSDLYIYTVFVKVIVDESKELLF